MGSFNNLLFKNYWARKAEIYMKGFWGSGGATIVETIFTCVYIGKIF
jgi:hypothetical protein